MTSLFIIIAFILRTQVLYVYIYPIYPIYGTPTSIHSTAFSSILLVGALVHDAYDAYDASWAHVVVRYCPASSLFLLCCAAQVFRPGHILPTMSIEELAEQEVAEAMEREAAEREAQQHAKELDSDDEESVRQQRAKDDWKDANPRGWGNSKLRPCG